MVNATAFIDGDHIRKARAVGQIVPIYERLANELKSVPELRYIKIYPGRLTASNILSVDGKKNPVVAVGGDGIVGVELLVDSDTQVLQFYALTSAVKGCGRRIVAAVVSATPEEWRLVVLFDWSGGFWQRMMEDYPRLVIF
jgi:hypothetical protein